MDPSTSPSASLGASAAGSRWCPSPHRLARDRESSCAGSVGCVGSMVSERPQRADDVLDSILLEQADGGDAGGSSVEARGGVFYADAAESENGDVRLAGIAQGGETCRWRVFLLKRRSIFFFKHRSEDGEVGGLRFGAEDVGGSVTGDGHEKAVRGRRLVCRKPYNRAHLPRGEIVRAQMNAVDSGGKRDVGAGGDEETSSETRSRCSVLSSQWNAIAHGGQGVPCQYFQCSRAQIFFAELDVVDARAYRFDDFGEQGVAASGFVAAKLAAGGDVIEQTAVRHQLSAYYGGILKLCGADTFVRGNGSTRQLQRQRTRVSAPHGLTVTSTASNSRPSSAWRHNCDCVRWDHRRRSTL